MIVPKPGESGFSQDVLRRLRQLERLPRKEGAPQARVSVIEDFAANRFTVTAEFPMERIDDPQTGETLIRAVDVLETQEVTEINA